MFFGVLLFWVIVVCVCVVVCGAWFVWDAGTADAAAASERV